MATKTVRELLSCLNDTDGLSNCRQICDAAQQAVDEVQEFIESFEQRVGKALDDVRRLQLADHLWTEHVDETRCGTGCPFEAELLAWRPSLTNTRLWAKWQRSRREEGWLAYKTLSVYLSLKMRGWDSSKKKPRLERRRGRLILADGNNRVRILAAIGALDLKLDVAGV